MQILRFAQNDRLSGEPRTVLSQRKEGSNASRWTALAPIWIDRLVQVNPQHPGEEGYHGCGRQEEQEARAHAFGKIPAQQRPNQYGEQHNDDRRDAAAEVHRDDSVSRRQPWLQN